MIRELPASLTKPWRSALIVAWAIVNGILIAYAFEAFLLRPDSGNDWGTWLAAATAVQDGTLYASSGVFVWSPIVAWLFVAITPLGYWTWFAIHVGSVLLLRNRLLIVAVLTSGPFWIDTTSGNFFTFVALAGGFAIRGSRVGGIAFLALTLLMPRPIQVPLAIWLVARNRELWLPAAGLVSVSAVLVGLSGYAGEWLAMLRSYGAAYPFPGWDLGPTRFLGSLWLIVGIPLATWLLWHGRVGWAGMAMSPYLIPQYPLALLWEWANRRRRPRRA